MSVFSLSHTFRDFETFSAHSRNWDVDFLRLRSEEFSSYLHFYGDNDIQIADVRFDCHLHQRGSAPSGYYTFAVHHPESQPHKWRFLDCPNNSIIIFPRNNELQSVSMPGFHTYAVSIKESFLLRVAESSDLPDISRFLHQGTVNPCDGKIIGCLQLFLQLLSKRIHNSSGTLSHGFNYDEKWLLSKLLLDTLAHAKGYDISRKQNHYQQVAQRVVSHIHANLSGTICIDELCDVGMVSDRSLRNIFYDILGMSPSRYMKIQRLGSVRKQLAEAAPTNNLVVDIANSHGFWHMGQFAKDYRTLFGELPSATLNH